MNKYDLIKILSVSIFVFSLLLSIGFMSGIYATSQGFETYQVSNLWSCHDGCFYAEKFQFNDSLVKSSELYNYCADRCWRDYIGKGEQE
jgi:hypothetical protein